MTLERDQRSGKKVVSMQKQNRNAWECKPRPPAALPTNLYAILVTRLTYIFRVNWYGNIPYVSRTTTQLVWYGTVGGMVPPYHVRPIVVYGALHSASGLRGSIR